MLNIKSIPLKTKLSYKFDVAIANYVAIANHVAISNYVAIFSYFHYPKQTPCQM